MLQKFRFQWRMHERLITWSLIVVVALSASAYAQAPVVRTSGSLPIEKVMLSPDGEHISFVKHTEDSTYLFVASTKTLGNRRPVTIWDKSMGHLRWSADSQHLIIERLVPHGLYVLQVFPLDQQQEAKLTLQGEVSRLKAFGMTDKGKIYSIEAEDTGDRIVYFSDSCSCRELGSLTPGADEIVVSASGNILGYQEHESKNWFVREGGQESLAVTPHRPLFISSNRLVLEPTVKGRPEIGLGQLRNDFVANSGELFVGYRYILSTQWRAADPAHEVDFNVLKLRGYDAAESINVSDNGAVWLVDLGTSRSSGARYALYFPGEGKVFPIIR